MFDIGWTEILLIAVVAILVIGPKDMPLALRTAGRWIGKIRKMSGHFRAGLDAMVREAEMEDMEQKWKAQNEKIMREHPEGGPAEMEPTGAYPPAKQAELRQLAKEKSVANDEAAAIIAEKEAAVKAEAEAELAAARGSSAEDAVLPDDKPAKES